MPITDGRLLKRACTFKSLANKLEEVQIADLTGLGKWQLALSTGKIPEATKQADIT